MTGDFRFSISDWFLGAALLLMAGGCLPHSCAGAGPSRALLPADSLSRRVARSAPMDTLRRVWRTEASEDVPLRFPRTAVLLPPDQRTGEAALAVSDARRGVLLFFSKRGQLVRTVRSDSFAAPYLVGQRADTLLVLSPEPRRVHFVEGGAVRRRVTLALPPPEEAPLLWATTAAGALFAKTVDGEGRATVTRHGWNGHATAQHALGPPRWHHAGPLRVWRDSLLSLSGFRPVAHRLPSSLDTARALRLTGFDSPMLPRTRQYAEGDTRQPPLLLPDAAPAGSLLFALNLHPGRLRIDVFGPGGRLEARLTSPGPPRSEDVYPRALAVRRRAGGGDGLAVALTAPRPAVALYRWRPGSTLDSTPVNDGRRTAGAPSVR
jgi:hypothetical protein